MNSSVTAGPPRRNWPSFHQDAAAIAAKSKVEKTEAVLSYLSAVINPERRDQRGHAVEVNLAEREI